MDEVATRIDDGASLADVKDDYNGTFLMNASKIVNYYLGKLGGRKQPCEIRIFFGRSGTGKSYHARKGDYWMWPHPCGERHWAPGYEGQKIVIIDEFRHQFPLDKMLMILDRYELPMESKGSSFQLASTTEKIIITTNIHPLDWYPNVEDKSMLYRRIYEFGRVINFTTRCIGNPEAAVFVADTRWEQFCMQTFGSRHNFAEDIDEEGEEAEIMDLFENMDHETLNTSIKL